MTPSEYSMLSALYFRLEKANFALKAVAIEIITVNIWLASSEFIQNCTLYEKCAAKLQRRENQMEREKKKEGEYIRLDLIFSRPWSSFHKSLCIC